MPEKILIIGSNSRIAKEFLKKLSKTSIVHQPKKRDWDMRNLKFTNAQINLIKKVDKILLLQSIISPKQFLKRTEKNISSQTLVNLFSIIKISEIALKFNKKVKIIILGSESGIKGSYDIVYALTKASLHKYVEERQIKYSKQQLICISPSTILDSRMTIRRKDQSNIRRSILQNPKKRAIVSKEVSDLIYSLFYEQSDYLSNIVIRMDGGKFARMKF